MKAAGHGTIDAALQYFDEDGSGTISRHELNEGFKRMGAVLNEASIKNLFSILDQNNDDEISCQELEAVFAKYLGGDDGGKQKKVDRLEELERHIPRDDHRVVEAPAFQKKGPLELDVHDQ